MLVAWPAGLPPIKAKWAESQRDVGLLSAHHWGTMAPTPVPAGEWVSPISSQLITSKVIKLSGASLDEHGRLFWVEGRPTEAGRQVLVMRSSDGSISDVTPGSESGLNVRTTVHEYGGGDYLVTHCTAFFSNFSDQRVYRQEVPLSGSPGTPTPITPEGQGLRFADYAFDAARQRLVAVAEEHPPQAPDSHHVDNYLVGINARTGNITQLTSGHDFYSNPRVSPDGGRRMCWVAWDFPQMPWDGTLLMVADVQEDGLLTNIQTVAGGKEESIQQPVWSEDGSTLYFIGDKSGWWNLYRYHDGQVSLVHGMDVEFGFPPWVFGTQSYEILNNGQLLTIYSDPKEAGCCLGLITPGKGLSKLHAPFATYGSPARIAARLQGGTLSLAAVAGGPKVANQVVLLEGVRQEDLQHAAEVGWKVVRSSAELQLDEGFLSVPEAIEFPTDNGQAAHLLYYAPRNRDHILPEGQRPPLLVRSHGGPTSAAQVSLDLTIQYLTSRGYAVADVDYGGSTGYGREYRNRLRGAWGIVDVADCTNAALHLAGEGHVDRKRLCIFGQSAGGFSTLACLAFKDAFAAGASLFGVADLEALAKDTHKFESRYLDTLVGPYPERRDLYVERSPISHIDGFKAPIIFFQGDQDKVVLPSQATSMHDAVKARGLPTALLMFGGEQHGFRQAVNIRLSLDGMHYFLGRVLGFKATMPSDLPSFKIDNLDA